MELVKAEIRDIPIIQGISDIAWPHTFRELLPPEQIAYMMNMMYSSDSLQKQIGEQNHHYLLAKENDDFIGYLSYELNYKSSGLTKVHKIYILPGAQGKGLGRFFIENVSQISRQHNDKGLSLNVNKYNDRAIAFYKKMGFEIVRKEENDIGKGFIMDDYVLDKIF